MSDDYQYKELTIEDLEDLIKTVMLKPKPQKYTHSAAILLALSDDEFKMAWNGPNDNITYIGGAETIKKIDQRAKELGLK